MRELFLSEAKANKVFPIGGGLWTGLHPEFVQQNPASEFFYTRDVIEVPEATAAQTWPPQQHRDHRNKVEP